MVDVVQPVLPNNNECNRLYNKGNTPILAVPHPHFLSGNRPFDGRVMLVKGLENKTPVLYDFWMVSYFHPVRELTMLKPLPDGPAQLVLAEDNTAVFRWAQTSQLPCTVWTVQPAPAAWQRRDFAVRVLGNVAQVGEWATMWATAANQWVEPHLLLLADLHHLVDPAFLPALQTAWVTLLHNRPLTLVLSSQQPHVLTADSPISSLFTAVLPSKPPPFYTLIAALPTWSAAERIAWYALLGTDPAYTRLVDGKRPFLGTLRHLLSPHSPLLYEPPLRLHTLFEEVASYTAILMAVAHGEDSFTAISDCSTIGKTHLAAYLGRLQTRGLLQRHLPVTLPLDQQTGSRRGRYRLTDPVLRFYLRFLAVLRPELLAGETASVFARRSELAAFIAQSGFVPLVRQWIQQQGNRGKLPFRPEAVGGHWSHRSQVDVVAIHHPERQIAVGLCDWTLKPVAETELQSFLTEKVPHLLLDLPDKGAGWQVYPLCVARSGFTAGVRQLARTHPVQLVTLTDLEQGLRELAV